MELNLHDIRANSIELALDRARQYRSLLEPEMAESICLDILNIDEDNQQAIVLYILSLSDQLHHPDKQAQSKVIQQAIEKLDSDYRRHYYSGLLNERQARFLLSQPMSRSFAYDYFIEALQYYEQAEQLRPENNDEAILRWNSCIRTIQKEKLEPRIDNEDILIDMES
tara:strand:+ start:278 stop:781 length:504 start_codon:yes stop_codon:yes gene_type:complete